MWIIGCDLHTRNQTVAAVNTETGEEIVQEIEHRGDQARDFYAALEPPALVGIEATGAFGWFERLLGELGHRLWVGDAARIRAADPRKQKNNVRDAKNLCRLLREKRFPRIWLPSLQERDVRQLLSHRSKLVRFRTDVYNQLQALALGQGLRRGRSLWSEPGRRRLEQLPLGDWASQRRQDLVTLLDQLDQRIDQLDRAVQAEAERRPEARRLMEQPGVGPVTALAFVLIVGPVRRFARSKQLVSYLGLNPRENSSGSYQRLGHISKQGNTMLRWLLVEAGQTAARQDESLHRFYLHLKYRRTAGIAKVAVARKLAVRMYWVLRRMQLATQPASRQGSPGTDMVEAIPSNS